MTCRSRMLSGLFALALFFSLLILAGCAQLDEEDERKAETNKIELDRDEYQKEFLAREDQQGYVPFDSKYGYDLPEVAGYTDGFVDYLGRSVTFTAPYEGVMRDFLEDGEGGVFVFQGKDGILYYDGEGIPSRICPDPGCTVGAPCTHGMDIAGSYVQYWKGNLYFIGYREEPWPDGEEQFGVDGLPVRSYVMRYDIETGTFRKLIEFFDRTCFMFTVRDGVLFLVSGEDAEEDAPAAPAVKYLSSVDLETGEACRICIGASDAYGICEGKIVLQFPDYGKQWDYVEYRVQLMDPEDGSLAPLAVYTSPYCGAAGKYVLYLGRWENGRSYDLLRRDPNAETPEVMGRSAAKFRTREDVCVWLCTDGSLWRSDVNFYEPRKLASKVADFRIQDDGRIVYFVQKGFFRKVKTEGFGIETLGDGSLWVTTGFYEKEKVWEASGQIRWLAVCAVGKSTAFVTAMYYEILYPDDYQFRQTRIIKQNLNGEPPQTLYRRPYNMSDEEYRSHQTTVNERHVKNGDYWFVDNFFRYYSYKPEKYQ